MRRTPISLSFPPFTKAIKTLIISNSAIFAVLLVLGVLRQQSVADAIIGFFGLRPTAVVHGYIYQLITYSFIHLTFFHLLFNMLMLWMFGSMLESSLGTRKFWEFYLFGAVGAALVTVALAFTVGEAIHLSPTQITAGASGGIYAILMAAAMLFGDQEVYLFPLPFAIKMKYLVAILGAISLVGALNDVGGTANVAHLGGLLFGYLYLKFIPRKGLALGFSEGYFGAINSYHRWKRRRAAKKFQVYMRKHQQDPKQYFDEYGNFRPPDDKDKTNGGSTGGWVN